LVPYRQGGCPDADCWEGPFHMALRAVATVCRLAPLAPPNRPLKCLPEWRQSGEAGPASLGYLWGWGVGVATWWDLRVGRLRGRKCWSARQTSPT